MTDPDPLTLVRTAMTRYRDAEKQAHQVVVAASRAGVTKVSIAREAGITRPTVNRWIAEADDERPRAHVKGTMHGALRLLADRASAKARERILALADNDDVETVVLAFELARAVVGDSAWDRLPSENKTIIRTAETVAKAARDAGWPEEVEL